MTALSGNKGDSRRKRRGKASYPEVRARIEQLADGSQMPAGEIHRIIEEEFGEVHAPHVRTVQDMVEEARTLGPSELWEFADAKPEHIVLVTPVWVTALEQGVRLTKKQVRWIIPVRSLAPDLPSEDVWRIVGFYAMEERIATQSRDELDALLAFAPWRGVANAERYFAAVNSARIPSPSLMRDVALRAIPQENGQYRPTSDSQAAVWLKSHRAHSMSGGAAMKGALTTRLIKGSPRRRKVDRK